MKQLMILMTKLRPMTQVKKQQALRNPQRPKQTTNPRAELLATSSASLKQLKRSNLASIFATTSALLRLLYKKSTSFRLQPYLTYTRPTHLPLLSFNPTKTGSLSSEASCSTHNNALPRAWLNVGSSQIYRTVRRICLHPASATRASARTSMTVDWIRNITQGHQENRTSTLCTASRESTTSSWSKAICEISLQSTWTTEISSKTAR